MSRITASGIENNTGKLSILVTMRGELHTTVSWFTQNVIDPCLCVIAFAYLYIFHHIPVAQVIRVLYMAVCNV